MTLIYFEIVSTVALVLGLLLGNLFKPGAGLSIPADGVAAVASVAQAGQALSTVDFLLNVIPKTVLDALAGGAMLQILLVALLFGYALFVLFIQPGRVIYLSHRGCAVHCPGSWT